ELDELCILLQKEHLSHAARRLHITAQMLAQSLCAESEQGEREQAFVLLPERREVLGSIVALLRKAARPASGLTHGTAHRLERAADTLSLFQTESANHVLYIQHGPDDEVALCAASRATPAQLARDLWQTGRPAILASGTLAAGGSFVRVRQRLGLEKIARCREFSAQSPFDYERNCLLYLPSAKPGKGTAGVDAENLAGQVRTLLQAAHGHALVLFTSYILMREVCERLRGTVAFPLLEAGRGKLQVVQQFKQLPNAVLCAAGPCWEGIDFPGDMVSLLVIVRLPFPVPDPVSEAEREQYASLQEYIQTAIVPEMQTKLRQGVGRAIRTETDTCAVAILDGRAAVGGRYHTAVRKELPPCSFTSDVADVKCSGSSLRTRSPAVHLRVMSRM
ncbi:MAG: ATP-dependent DNA helicase, partial [Muribaculaceae bacterium]|nr:ATP-dependent DNA helicase [Muribaculaceae bacterium]